MQVGNVGTPYFLSGYSRLLNGKSTALSGPLPTFQGQVAQTTYCESDIEALLTRPINTHLKGVDVLRAVADTLGSPRSISILAHKTSPPSMRLTQQYKVYRAKQALRRIRETLSYYASEMIKVPLAVHGPAYMALHAEDAEKLPAIIDQLEAAGLLQKETSFHREDDMYWECTRYRKQSGCL